MMGQVPRFPRFIYSVIYYLPNTLSHEIMYRIIKNFYVLSLGNKKYHNSSISHKNLNYLKKSILLIYIILNRSIKIILYFNLKQYHYNNERQKLDLPKKNNTNCVLFVS